MVDYTKSSVSNLALGAVVFAGVVCLCVFSPSTFTHFFQTHVNCPCPSTKLESEIIMTGPKDELEMALERASMVNKTVIIAMVNKAYAEGGSLGKTMLQLFLEGFWLGEDTRGLVDHLLLVAMDQIAFDRCKFLKLHCYKLETEGVDFGGEKLFMSEEFIKMMWRRTLFLGDVLRRGYNFIFTTTMSISSPKDELTAALERASMGNKTVIIAIVNKAYVEGEQSPQKSMFDLFLESFWLGEGTQGLLDHLLVVAVDQVAYKRCNFLRLHCYRLVTEGVDFTGEEFYMSKDFIKMMWKRTQFLGNVLKRGYNFIFTDTDVMWLRNPFLKLVQNDTYDLQISCDFFHGNPRSEAHQINTGLYYIRSSNKTIALFELWHAMKSNYPGVKEQDVLIKLMHRGVFRELGLRLKVMDTLYFSGFCEDSRDLRAVTTVHANCCRGLNAKIADVVNVLQDWRKFKNSANHTLAFSWSQHNACIHSW